MATIITKNSSTASSAPTSVQLVQGELAVNVTDKRLFTEDNSGAIVELGTNPSTLTLSSGTANGVGYLNGSKVLTSGSALTFNGTSLGIGTTSPNAALNVVGITRLARDGLNLSIANAANTTGMYIETDSTGNILKISNNGGTERLRIDSSGNLGLGVTPSGWLSSVKAFQVGYGAFRAFTTSANTYVDNNNYVNSSGTDIYLNNGAAGRYRIADNQHLWYSAPSGTAGNAISFTQAMTLNASGNFGVGTSSPSQKLVVRDVNKIVDSIGNVFFATTDAIATDKGAVLSLGGVYTSGIDAYAFGAISARKTNATSGDASGYLTFATTASNNAVVERARITSTGIVLVGKITTSVEVNGHRFDADGASFTTISAGNDTHYIRSSTAAAYRFYVKESGTVFATNPTISAISDSRFKENVRDLDIGLDKIMALKPRLFDWKEGKGVDIKNARGFIAQEFETVFPDLIDEWKDPAPEGEEPYKSVRADLIPILVKAIQEQQALIVSLTARLDAAGL